MKMLKKKFDGLKKTVACFESKNNGGIWGFSWWFWGVIIFLVLIKLFLISGQHILALGDAGYDDRLFVNIANNLLKLHWLGNYDNLTLAKGPGYPIWIALTFVLGIPLLFSQYLLYILACITSIIALKPLFSKKYYLLLIIFLLVLFNPSSFSNEVTTRVFREGIYPALSLFVIAFSIGILTRRNRAIKNIIIWIIGLGVSLSFFWLTREEGIWIMPFLISILLFTSFKLWKKRENQWKLKVILLVIPFVMLYLSIFIISSINYYNYGIFAVVEFKNPEFLEAYGSLTRVKDTSWHQFVPVSKEKRMRIYNVSPSFKKLKPFLEGDLGQNWAQNAPEAMQSKDSYTNGSYEIFGGWFMWAFRDAVKSAGYYKNGKDTIGYYKQMSVEINTACEKKELDCFRKRKTMMDPFYKEQINPILNSFIETFKYLANFNGTKVSQTTSSLGNKNSLDLFSKITHEPVYTNNVSEIGLEIKGWAFSPSEKVFFSIVNNEDKIQDYNVEINESPDVYASFSAQGNKFNNAKRARFSISTECKNNCFLLVSGQDNLNEKIPLDGSITSVNKNGKLFVYIDDLGQKQNNQIKSTMEKINTLKLSMLNNIGNLYRFSMFFLTILSLLVFTTITFIRNKNILYFINLFLLLSIFARIILIAIINATSFPAINSAYLSPLHPMIIFFVLLNLISIRFLFIEQKTDISSH